jgi:hypothetical protein
MTDRNKLKPRRSYTSGTAPVITGSSPDLEQNEISINYADRILYVRDPSDQLLSIPLGGSGGGTVSIIEAATVSAFPAVGASGKLYVATNESRVYRWDASGVYVEIGPQ